METTGDNQTAKANRRAVQASTTLSRRYTKRPQIGNHSETVEQSPRIRHFEIEQIDETAQSFMTNSSEEPMENLETAINWEQQSQAEMAPAQQMAQQMMQSEERQMMQPEMQPAAQQMRQAQEQQMRQAAQQMAPAQAHPIQVAAKAKMQKRTIKVQDVDDAPRVSARELKDQAIKKALASASRVASESAQKSPKSQGSSKTQKTQQMQMKSKKSRKSAKTLHFGFGRVMLALSCATAAVVAIVYFVNMNMPDISLRVAAMQTGMDPSYPTYVPRNYSVSGITSEEGKIEIDFANTLESKKFTLIEEKSSWDTNALLTNFVKPEYGEDYTIVREQGLTIYISGSNAAWVNGGNVYKIEATNNTLTNKQIKSIAVSL